MKNKLIFDVDVFTTKFIYDTLLFISFYVKKEQT